MKYNKDKFFMTIAHIISRQSHCVSKQVGAIIVYEDRIISMGYNGTPSGYVNCCDVFNPNNFDKNKHHIFSSNYEIHAEANAIAFAAKSGLSTKDSTIYVTLSPCNDCAKLIIASGIKRVVYDKLYTNNSIDVIEFLKTNKVEVSQSTFDINLLK